LHDGAWVSADQAKSDAIFDYFNSNLGAPFSWSHSILLDNLLPQLELSGMDVCFSKQEVWEMINEMPSDRAPGPDGFTGLFYKVAWPSLSMMS